MISVIVPVYNAAKYLEKCIQSILAQTYSDLELLLIDDGSKDLSGEICDKYAELDSRIRVFHKMNGGVSSARNLGLDNAKGEWVTFIDSDDVVKEDYLYAMISPSDADLIVSSFEFLDKIEDWDNTISKRFYQKEEIKDFLDRYIWSVALCAPFCKLFKRSLIGDIRFDINIAFKEDTIFVFQYLCRVNTIYTVESYSYQYRRGLNESLSVKALPLNQCRYIIQEYTNNYKKMESVFAYHGDYARVANNSNNLNRCLCALRDSKASLKTRYADFVMLMNDDGVKEVIEYKNKFMYGYRRRFFDFLAKLKLYPFLFFYLLTYKGTIY